MKEINKEGIEVSRKFLESERLILKPLSFNELLAINNNDIEDVESEAIFDSVRLAISKKLNKMKNINEEVHEWYTYWLIINKSNEKGIGFIGFKGLPDENGYLEIGYSISHNYRRQRIMTEALKTLVRWAAGFQDCREIIARVLKTNVGSCKVLANCNFKVSNSNEKEETYTLKFR